MKTVLCLVSLGLTPLQAPVALARTGETEPLHLFASCVGRLSAVMEHQWLVDGPASDRTKAERDGVLSLMEAVIAPDQQVMAMQWRISAKVAQAELLARMRAEPENGRLARRATELADACRALVLPQS